MTTHFLQTNEYSIALLNKKDNKFLLISGFTAKDNSSYFEINSGVKKNFIKFSYHPRENIFQFAFKQELWKFLSENNKGKPNKERIKSKIENLSENQHLCSIFVDQSSLFRKNIPVDVDYLPIDFIDNKIFQIDIYLENKIYKLNTKIDRSNITGIAQLVNDFNRPWKILCIGV